MAMIRYALLLALPLLLARPVLAEHEHDHRYLIQGYVLDAGENPRADVPVSAALQDGPHGGARTDGDGYYQIRLHLHDSDIGKSIRVTAGDSKGSVRMQAEAGNQTHERVHHVNFIGPELVERALSRGRLPRWAVGVAIAAGVVAAGWLLVWAERRRRRRLRLARQEKRAAEQPPARKRPRKRRRARS